jgi:hypothetical protein
MKNPRIEDFDPQQHQLPQLRSPIDHYPKIEKPKEKTLQEPSEHGERSDETERAERPQRSERNVRVLQKPTEHKSQRREIRRHSFEIFIDQVTSLQEMRITRMKEGELKSMSSMVREALDEYIQKQK